MRRSTAILCLAAAAGLALSQPARADGEVIAVFTKNQTNPFFQFVRVGSEKAAKSMGASTINYVPTKPDSIPEQMSQVEDVAAKKPSAVVFTPVDYRAMVPGVELLNKAGIPVVNVTDRMSQGKFVSFVGVDDYKLGYETAKLLIDALGGKGKVIILEGVKGSISSADRVRGFGDAAKEAKGIQVLTSQPANFQRLNALQVMENLQQTYPQIDGVLAANDAMAIGAIEALDGAGRKAAVVGINGTQEAIDAIKKGTLLATGSADPFMQGCLATMAAVRSLRGQPVVSEFYFPALILTKANYQAFDVPVEARECAPWDKVVASK